MPLWIFEGKTGRLYALPTEHGEIALANSPEIRYREISAALREMPEITDGTILGEKEHMWLGRVFALIEAEGDLMSTAGVRVAVDNIHRMRTSGLATIKVALFRALARAERDGPDPLRGAFIATGAAFTAYAAISKIMQSAKDGILVVDPYFSAEALVEYLPTAEEGRPIRLLIDGRYKVLNEGVRVAAEKWKQQFSATRPLEVRVTAPPVTLHDRLITVDSKEVWVMTQSFKDIAAKSHAAIVGADAEIAAAKIEAYETIWGEAGAL